MAVAHKKRRAAAFIAALACAITLASVGVRAGEGAAVAETVKSLQERYDSISTVTAKFTQETGSPVMGAMDTASGRVWFKKPGKMKWVYEKPSGDVLASDGTTLWLYQADLNQAVARPAGAVTSTVATDFLSGVGVLEEEFRISLDSETPEAVTLGLEPREPLANIKRLAIVVRKKDHIVVGTESIDFFGNTTTVTFSDVVVNATVGDEEFLFAPPEGAAVIRE